MLLKLKLLILLFAISLQVYAQNANNGLNYVEMAKKLVSAKTILADLALPIIEEKEIWRCPDNGIQLNLPMKNNLYGDSVIITWQLDKNIKGIDGYFIRMTNIDESLVETYITKANQITLYFNKTTFKNVNSIIFNIAYIIPEGKADKKKKEYMKLSSCDGIYFHRLEPKEKKEIDIFLQKQVLSKEKESLKLLSFALFLHNNSLFVDALSNYRKAYDLASEKEKLNYLKILNEFIQTNRL